MMELQSIKKPSRFTWLMLITFATTLILAGSVNAHPLGNFTVNHFSRLVVATDQVRVRYVVDLAEIPTFQESQIADADGNGKLDQVELQAYLTKVSKAHVEGLKLLVEGERIPLRIEKSVISLPVGSGGLPTLRLEFDLAGDLVASDRVRTLAFEDTNQTERIGWHEIVVAGAASIRIFNSNGYGNGVTDELKNYPADLLAAPLSERSVTLSWSNGTVPSGATALLTRSGQPVIAPSIDRFAALISVSKITPIVAILGMLLAMGFGALHAFSPGHGKAVVGAYLVGSRGTPRHAAFLGLTVTVTHTIGVFVLGFVTLFASHYILPEQLFPLLGLASGVIVLVMGLTMFTKRLRAAVWGDSAPHPQAVHDHDGGHHHHGEAHTHDDGLTHSHGGTTHTHLPPGADGTKVTWRSLLALGISGGMLPCPSALVLMLSAITLQRVGYGMLLVVAFSVGLAATLTGVGLIFIYGKRLLGGSFASGRLVRVLPVASAAVIAALGAAICYQALDQSGIHLTSVIAAWWHGASPDATTMKLSAVSVLGLGFLLGLKHATEADHLAAVSTIVSERKSLLGSSLVGGLWGLGHTISLFIAGIVVILLHLKIGERTAMALEFCVALMLVGLGLNALRKLWHGGKLHLHAHRHGGHQHAHLHVHETAAGADPHTHHGLRFGARPLLVGMVHGLAGSAALMLLVLSAISSPWVGMLYVVIFGVGSIGGMMIMSALVGLPVHLTAGRFTRANVLIRSLAGVFSFGFGLTMIYQIGFVDGLFR
ncbi:MAG: hypothetical protein ABIP75_10060 [Pyrinomonadaceae bacterium]